MSDFHIDNCNEIAAAGQTAFKIACTSESGGVKRLCPHRSRRRRGAARGDEAGVAESGAGQERALHCYRDEQSAAALEGPCPYCTVSNFEVDWKEIMTDRAVESSSGYLIDTESGGRFPLLGFRFRIGRDASNQVEVKDSAASRMHALITCEEGRYFVDDLGSTNGTLLNGSLVTRRQRLVTGDILKIGKTMFGFVQEKA